MPQWRGVSWNSIALHCDTYVYVRLVIYCPVCAHLIGLFFNLTFFSFNLLNYKPCCNLFFDILQRSFMSDIHGASAIVSRFSQIAQEATIWKHDTKTSNRDFKKHHLCEENEHLLFTYLSSRKFLLWVVYKCYIHILSENEYVLPKISFCSHFGQSIINKVYVCDM